MSEHLPECPWAPHDCDEDMCERCDRGCYCNELRACEQRVWEKFPAALSATSVQSMSIYGQGLRERFLSAIDAAEAAVAAMPLTGGWTTPAGGWTTPDGVIEEIEKAKTIAAIDACSVMTPPVCTCKRHDRYDRYALAVIESLRKGSND